MIKAFFGEIDGQINMIKALSKDYERGQYFKLKDEVLKKYNITKHHFFTTNTDIMKCIEDNLLFKNKIIDLVDKKINLYMDDNIYENDRIVFEYDIDDDLKLYSMFKYLSCYKEVEIEEFKFFMGNQELDMYYCITDFIVELKKNLMSLIYDRIFFDEINQVIEGTDLVKYNIYFNLKGYVSRIKNHLITLL